MSDKMIDQLYEILEVYKAKKNLRLTKPVEDDCDNKISALRWAIFTLENQVV